MTRTEKIMASSFSVKYCTASCLDTAFLENSALFLAVLQAGDWPRRIDRRCCAIESRILGEQLSDRVHGQKQTMRIVDEWDEVVPTVERHGSVVLRVDDDGC